MRIRRNKQPSKVDNQLFILLVDMKEKEDQGKKKIVALKVKKEDAIIPVISASGPCVLILNIGGQCFKLFQNEISKGLI